MPISYAPIKAGAGGIVTEQLDSLPGSGVSAIGVNSAGKLSHFVALTAEETEAAITAAISEIEVGAAWGGITGTLSDQTDLQAALDAKLATATASSTYLPLAGGTNGNGQFQISITASVGAVGVRNVQVSIQGTDTKTSTGTLGTGTLNVDAGSYTLIVTPPSGYEPIADIAVTVAANVNQPIALTATTVTLADAPLTNVVLPTEDQYGNRLPNVTVKFTFLSHAEGASITGVVLNTPAPKASDEDGICRVQLRRLANYRAEYTIPGDLRPKTVTFATGNTGADTVVGV